MKKLLLASTALVLSAGVASAQVALSGDARMGITHDSARDAKLQFTSRARVTFTMSGETDGGLAFGASFRADQAAPQAVGNTNMTGGNVFIRGEFGRVRFGDVSGAARAAVGDLYGVGFAPAADLNNMGYLDRNPSLAGVNFLTFNRNTAVLYDYSIEGFTFYLGLAQPNRVNGASAVGASLAANATGAAPALAAGDSYRENQYSIGMSYSFDGLTAALGYETARGKSTIGGVSNTFSGNHVIGSLEYQMDDIKAKAIVGRLGGDLGTAFGAAAGISRTQYGVSVEGSFDATTVTAYYQRGFAQRQYGIGASYDLGGGASLQGGVSRAASNNTAGLAGRTMAGVGLNFSF